MPEPIRRGVVAALWTPTDAEGRLLEAELRRHLAFLRSAGVDGLLALGSTGEFVHFSETERTALLGRIAELAAPLPVLANVSDVSPAAACRLARAAKAAGCVGLAVLPPWYFALNQDDLLAFFLRVAGATDLPVCLYNFPERTGNRIALGAIAAFADRAPLSAVKQSGGEWEYHRELCALGRERGFGVFTGCEPRLDEALAIGCAGTISGLANFMPEPLVRVVAAAGPVTEPMGLIRRVIAACGRVGFPLDVAAGMRARGFMDGAFKQVVAPATLVKFDGVTAEIRTLLGEAGLLR